MYNKVLEGYKLNVEWSLAVVFKKIEVMSSFYLYLSVRLLLILMICENFA